MEIIINMPQYSKARLTVFFAFAAIYIIWGSTYLAILVAIKGIPPFFLSGLRFLIAGILLFAWCRVNNNEKVNWQSIRRNSVYGILMLAGGTGSIAWAEQYLPSSITAIIVTSVPFWFVLLDKKQWKFYFSNKIILAGILTGFAGVTLLLCFSGSGTLVKEKGYEIWAAVAIIAGGISWTAGSLYSKYKPAGNSLLMNGSIQLIGAGMFSCLTGFLLGEHTEFSVQQVPQASWLALWYLIVFGSVITYVAYLWLLKVKPAAQVSTHVYINPIVALLLGVFIAGEKINTVQILALFIILIGVLLVNKPKYKQGQQ